MMRRILICAGVVAFTAALVGAALIGGKANPAGAVGCVGVNTHSTTGAYDLNEDYQVGSQDLNCLAQYFGHMYAPFVQSAGCVAVDGTTTYPYDLNLDNRVNSVDQFCLGQKFGHHYPTPTPTPTSTPTPTPTMTNTPTATPTPSETRNKYEWPFAQDSIWNMPIGSNATYVHAGLAPANGWGGEITYDYEIIDVDTANPERQVTTGSNRTYDVHIDPDSEWDGDVWNGCATFIDVDGDTLRSGQPLDLNAGGDGFWEYNYSNPYDSSSMSITGVGRFGCHGGSAMSGLGGSIRPGELGSSEPLRHALKINAFAERFLHCSNDGFRWPAYRADNYADCETYGGGVQAMRMGSLVAIHPSVNCQTFVSNAAAQKICHALQDYGAYVVDDTKWDVHAINIDVDVYDDISSRLGSSGHDDLMDLFSSLYVIDNNSPTSIGGGGTPRAPLAPPFE